jgi:hypothetical protein
MFRMLMKEYVVYYQNKARRREKTALVHLLISRLQANGFRFLHRSSLGIWVEAPGQLVKQKVGHGLRDARITANHQGDDLALLKKNSRPSAANNQLTNCLTPSATAGAAQNQEQCAENSVRTKFSKRWSLCFAQSRVEDVSSASFDHHQGDRVESSPRDNFIKMTVVSSDDFSGATSTRDTDVSHVLGNALSVCDDSGGACVDWVFDDPLQPSSFACEDGQSLLQWFREFS